MLRTVAFLGAAVSLGLLSLTTAAGAQTVRQKCSTDYQAAKTANTLAGATWNQFYSKCAAGLRDDPAPAPAAAVSNNPLKPTPAVATTPATTPPTTPAAPAGDKKPVSAGRAAFTERERQCGSEWRANTAALKTQYGSWPKYLSACNTRLKASAK